jgi:hypothetical protein
LCGTPTVSGTLTNCNALHLQTPSGGSTNRVIDTDSGGYLTTGGVWTDNPSWAALKDDITPVAPEERAALFDWLVREYKPVRYRYLPAYDEDGNLARFEDPEKDHPHFGYLLDDLPENVREIVCAGPEGGIAGKDERGLLFALVQEAGRRIARLETARV